MRRCLWSLATVLSVSCLSLVSPTTAEAIVILPGFEATPGSGNPGDQFVVDVNWPSPTGGFKGCSLPLDFAVWGPGGPDPQNGDYGPQIATGTLAASTFDAAGNTTSYGTATVSPTLPGTYSITIDPNGANTHCSQGEISPTGRGEFQVVSPTPPPDPQTLSLSPTALSRALGDTATITARLTHGTDNQPVPGAVLTFAVTGPNDAVAGACPTNTCTTDANGKVDWTYAGTATGHDTINARLGPQGAGGTLGQTTVDWTPTIKGAQYAALGDSYSSGEGTGAYIDGTNTPGVNMCHRSVLAYGPRWDKQDNLGDLGFVACSGAVTDDLFTPNTAANGGSNSGVEPAQLCQIAPVAAVRACGDARRPVVGVNTKVVTLTIGGNDLGFAKILESCVWGSVGPFQIPRRNCATSSAVLQPTLRRLGALSGLGVQQSPTFTLIHSYREVLSAVRTAAPNAQIYIAGYPSLFQNRTGKDCTIGWATAPNGLGFDIRVSAADAAWMDTTAQALNLAIATAVRGAGPRVTYVDAGRNFSGHGLCSASPWLTPIRATVSGPGAVVASPESAHPTLEGQSQGYQLAFRTAVKP